MEKPQYKWNDNAGDTNHVVVCRHAIMVTFTDKCLQLFTDRKCDDSTIIQKMSSHFVK